MQFSALLCAVSPVLPASQCTPSLINYQSEAWVLFHRSLHLVTSKVIKLNNGTTLPLPPAAFPLLLTHAARQEPCFLQPCRCSSPMLPARSPASCSPPAAPRPRCPPGALPPAALPLLLAHAARPEPCLLQPCCYSSPTLPTRSHPQTPICVTWLYLCCHCSSRIPQEPRISALPHMPTAITCSAVTAPAPTSPLPHPACPLHRCSPQSLASLQSQDFYSPLQR